MGKKVLKKPEISSLPSSCFNFQLPKSEYSIKYAVYMEREYPSVESLLREIIKLPCCRHFYLRFPLEGLLRAVCKKMMMNTYEVTIYGYFLSMSEWCLDPDIFGHLYQLFPDIMHVNQPVDADRLKQLSMFLYFSAYSVKDLLNGDIQMFRTEMLKSFPQFVHLHSYWVNGQPTTNFVLNPKSLNTFFKLIHSHRKFVDYNVSVDKIIQISPCYDINVKPQKPKTSKNSIQASDPHCFGAQRNFAIQQDDQFTEKEDVKVQYASEQLGNFKIIDQIM